MCMRQDNVEGSLVAVTEHCPVLRPCGGVDRCGPSGGMFPPPVISRRDVRGDAQEDRRQRGLHQLPRVNPCASSKGHRPG